MKSFLNNSGLMVAVTIAIAQAAASMAFTIPQPAISASRQMSMKTLTPLLMAENDNQVVELADDETEEQGSSEATSDESKTVAPFLSQGEISEEALEVDWSDPKQQRVMFYIILSLLPVLFLIPLMLGSRDLIPPEALPPVEMSLLL